MHFLRPSMPVVPVHPSMPVAVATLALLASCALLATACRGTGGPPPGHPARSDTPSSGSVAPTEARLWPEDSGAAEAVPAPGAPVLYTCPMHPEIVRDAPGSCPICKMDLEPMTPGAAGGSDAGNSGEVAR